MEEVEFPKAPSGKGKRLILLHAGGSTGRVPNAEPLFVGQKNARDSHDEMNVQHFEEWWGERFLPNLPAGCVIVMDNAPYHTRVTDDSRSPTTATRKANMQEWLTARGIPWRAEMLKTELYTIIKYMLAVLRNVNIANLTYSSPTLIYSTQTHTHFVSAQCTHVLTFRANAYSRMGGISFFLASFCFLCTVAKLVSRQFQKTISKLLP